jgi:nitrite reductase/ring-hydroxylating ferredoxin subunit
VLGLVAFAVTGAAGWLGGHLAYALGVGVDTTAFQTLPEEWTDACAEADLPDGRGMRVDVAGVPVLLARHAGRIVALADRCTHRGGPLHDGELADGCVTCPWHHSRFALDDGTVRAGPATRPQPTLEVRIESGRVQVRRPGEQRALRTNPIGV